MAKSTPEVNTPKTRSPMLLIAVIAVIAFGIMATAVAVYFYLDSQRPRTAVNVAPAAPIFVPLEPFTVNLQPRGRSRFLYVGLTLQVADAKSRDQITAYLPEVRNRILTTLANREPESLVTPENKAQLADEIIAALNPPFAPNLPPKKISSVMFTAFVLQ